MPMASAPPFAALGAWEDVLGNSVELIRRGGINPFSGGQRMPFSSCRVAGHVFGSCWVACQRMRTHSDHVITAGLVRSAKCH
jgi:hypothetical protein